MNCIVCNRNSLAEIFVLEGVPLFTQKVLETPHEGSSSATKVKLLQCAECSMVQIDPASIDHSGYWTDYLNSRACTDLYNQYDAYHAQRLVDKFALQGKQILEVGCGDGAFLERLRDLGVQVTGIEPSRKAVDVVRAKGVPVYHAFVDDQIENVVKDRFDGVICRQVLDLVKSPNTILHNTTRLLKPGACCLIDVPSWSKVLLDRRYYSILPDRIGYFTARTLVTFLERNNFHVLEVFHGAEDEYVGAYAIYQQPGHDLLTEFSGHFQEFKAAYQDMLSEFKRKKMRVAAWGAGAKGVTIFSIMKTTSQDISYVVDRDKTRWNRYMPGSLLKITTPDSLKNDPVDAVLITAAMFFKEIVKELVEQFNFRGAIATLSPVPRIVSQSEIDAILSNYKARV